MIHSAVAMYKPLQEQLEEIKNKTIQWKSSSHRKPHWTVPSTPQDIEDLNINISRSNQLDEILKSCLCKTDIISVNCGGWVNGLRVFFVHNGTLRQVMYNSRGLYCMTWKQLIEVLQKMEQVYAGP